MQENMLKLLKKIGFDEEKISRLNNVTLEKIIGNKTKTKYKFIFASNDLIDVELFDELKELLVKSFNDYESVKPFFSVTNINEEKVYEYYKYFVKNYSIEHPSLEQFIDLELKYDNNTLFLEVVGRGEELKFKSIITNLEKDFKSVGVPDIKFDINVKPIEEEDEEVFVKVVEVKENPLIKGKMIKGEATSLDKVLFENPDEIIAGTIFAVETKEFPTTNMITLKMTDYTDSIQCKMFEKNPDEYAKLKKALKEGVSIKVRGNVRYDNFSKEIVIFANDINKIEIKKEERKDNSEEKRVELHAHTMMSQMDGVIDASKLIKQAYKWGHAAVAVTDHSSVQSYPDVFHTVCDINKKLGEGEKPFKALYGVELEMVDIKDEASIAFRPNNSLLKENRYIVFDFETTGLYPNRGDSIIEIGAAVLNPNDEPARVKEKREMEIFGALIDPKRKLDKKITELTGITDEMLEGMPSEEEKVKEFKEFIKDSVLVAHNAKFDVSFLEAAYKKYGLGEFTNPVIDTLELSRMMFSNKTVHKLNYSASYVGVKFNEGEHHRATYDATKTAEMFYAMICLLESKEKITRMSELNSMKPEGGLLIPTYGHHINVIAKDKIGLKNLFKIISFANTKYLSKGAKIPRSELQNLREGLIVGSGCYNSEVFRTSEGKSIEEIEKIVKFYDYVEVQPLDCYSHLVDEDNDRAMFKNEFELQKHIIKIITACKNANVLVVATGDVHNLAKDDKIYREIIINQPSPGGGRHPMARYEADKIPSLYFRTTEEMLECFDFLDEETRYEIVIKNPNKIADMCEILEVIDSPAVPYSPKIENSVETVKDLVYTKAHNLYGDPLPELIDKRIDQELTGIIKGGFDVIYLIAQKLVKKSNDDGYLVGSRGSVGSSFVATMMGITEVNPLPAHYRCPNCKHSIFEEDGKPLGATYSSGFDLPDKKCPKCDTLMEKDGQDMPFATFLGFDADKVPDIDLNFSGEYQWKAHEYTKELFGVDNVYRAGTIGTVADKTAIGFVLGYFENKKYEELKALAELEGQEIPSKDAMKKEKRLTVDKRGPEIERLAMGCTGVKRTTGQHPGGIVVVPHYKDVFDFTPFQYPADDPKSLWRTTHFDYHAIDQDLLKLDILGHDDPTVLRMLQDISGLDVTKVPLDDKDTMEIFSSPKSLGVTTEQLDGITTGTLGVPEFGTKFVIGMLEETRPKTFAELVKISGLLHGTDVWLGNARDLCTPDENGVIRVPFKDVIGCRDDIMVYLMYHGLEAKKAFKIMEFVRKGKASKDVETWKQYEQDMKDANIEEWFIKSCQKIKYMFPKAHAAAYVLSAFRIAWFKVHHPIYYYSAYFSIRCNDFDIVSMIKGYQTIKDKIHEIVEKGYAATNKESSILDVLYSALECTARGITFQNVNINKSDATKFLIEGNTLIPPFRTIDGLGGTVAEKIVEEREKGAFLSIEDLQKRGKVSGTLIEKMRAMKMLEGLPETSQLSLF